MTHTVNHQSNVAVSTEAFWMPIDKDTPRNKKVLAIARHKSGVVSIGNIGTHENWFTHWYPLPDFIDPIDN